MSFLHWLLSMDVAILWKVNSISSNTLICSFKTASGFITNRTLGMQWQIELSKHERRICASVQQTLLQIMACCMFGAKPLPEPILPYHPLKLRDISQWTFILNSSVFTGEKWQSGKQRSFCFSLNVLKSRTILNFALCNDDITAKENVLNWELVPPPGEHQYPMQSCGNVYNTYI